MLRRFVQSTLLAAALLGQPVLLLSTPVLAQAEREAAMLDALFERLRSAPDDSTAQAITDQIWLHWTTPADPVLAARMRDVLDLRQRADFPAVIALLDDIVADYPDYAEGWNQRATIYYLLRDFDQSLADIDKVLEFEPRHFGALVGRAVIYENQGKHALALRDMATALAIHPFLVERTMFPELLDDATRI